MAIESKDINKIFTDDQKSMVALYEKQIDEQLVNRYIEGKEIKIEPNPFPYAHRDQEIPWGFDERVVNEVIKKYTEAGWLIKWVFNETGQIGGNWVFSLKKNIAKKS